MNVDVIAISIEALQWHTRITNAETFHEWGEYGAGRFPLNTLNI